LPLLGAYKMPIKAPTPIPAKNQANPCPLLSSAIIKLLLSSHRKNA
jgi:hypothetical protein